MALLPQGKKAQVSNRTLQRRVSQVKRFHATISGGDPKPLIAAEMKQIPKAERQALMKEAGFKLEVPEGEGLALKASLGIPWNKLRHLRR